MKRRDFLQKWSLANLKLNLPFLEGEFSPNDPDRDAAWELYVELLTRITTQNLSDQDGDEEAALGSVHALFSITRGILRARGSGAGEFAKLAIPVLNQVIRPFTAKWHKRLLAGDLKSTEGRADFRKELAPLQVVLRHYTRALADMAGVEDLTELEAAP